LTKLKLNPQSSIPSLITEVKGQGHKGTST